MKALKKFMKDEDGVTAIEYTLIAVVIAVGILAVVIGVRDWIIRSMTEVANIGPTS